MSTLPPSPKTNEILGALPEEAYQRLLATLEFVELPLAKMIYDIDDVIAQIYFPLNAMISLVTQMADGKIVEVGLVGKDGMSGISTLLGSDTSYERAIVQIPDGAMRGSVAEIRREFELGGAFQKTVLLYSNSLMRQICQNAACNVSHTAETRLARWLLMCQDRVGRPTMRLTQEFLAEMLGTSRGTVNISALALQSADLIKYQRGNITIIDRPGLESFSCECYEMNRRRDCAKAQARD